MGILDTYNSLNWQLFAYITYNPEGLYKNNNEGKISTSFLAHVLPAEKCGEIVRQFVNKLRKKKSDLELHLQTNLSFLKTF